MFENPRGMDGLVQQSVSASTQRIPGIFLMAATRNANAPGLLRRLAAIAYDSLLLGGILILASAALILAKPRHPHLHA